MHANSQPTTKAATMAIGIKENNISTLRKYLPFNIDFYAKKYPSIIALNGYKPAKITNKKYKTHK